MCLERGNVNDLDKDEEAEHDGRRSVSFKDNHADRQERQDGVNGRDQ